MKIDVPFVYVLNGRKKIKTNAVLNLATGEITDIAIDDSSDTYVRSYILLNKVQFDVNEDVESGCWAKLYCGHDGCLCTDNYAAHKEIMSSLSIVSIVRAVDYITTLSQLLNENNEILEDMDYVLEPLNEVIAKLKSNEKCPQCYGNIYKSDLPQYDTVCPECDENF